MLKLTVPDTTTLAEIEVGTLTKVAASALPNSGVALVALLLARLGSAVVLVTAALKLCTVELPAGTL